MMKWFKSTMWLAVAAALVFSFDLAAAQDAVDDPAQFDAGMAVFEANCASCHLSDGTGSAAGRPLTDIAIEQPDRSVHVTSVTEGIRGMPAWADVLSPAEIDSVVSYVRLGFVSQPVEQADTPAEEELAATGAEAPYILIAGVALLGAGFLFISSAQVRTRQS